MKLGKNGKINNMTTVIVILVYVANVFLNRFLTYLSVKNQGKNSSVTYDVWYIWFVPIIGNLWCTLDFLSSINNNFNGKNW